MKTFNNEWIMFISSSERIVKVQPKDKKSLPIDKYLILMKILLKADINLPLIKFSWELNIYP